MATISETELQRRLRSLEKKKSSSLKLFISGIDPVGTDFEEGSEHYNSTTGNLWIFSGGVWVLAVTTLHIRYATDVTNLSEAGIAPSQGDIVGFSELPYTAAGVQKDFRGLWFGGTVASTDSTDYAWTATSGADGYSPIKGTDYDDGISGNNIRVEYSIDGVTWVTTQSAGVNYLYIRTSQDTNNDGVYIPGIASKFVPEKGVEYDDGGTVAQITIYKRSSTALATPLGGEYNFTTFTLTPPSGWTHSIPSGDDPVYSSVTLANIIGNLGVDTTLTWSSPESIISNGSAGKSVYTTNVFLRSVTEPGTPVTDTGSFSFGTNILTAPTGSPASEVWYTSVPNGSTPLYASEVTFSVFGDTGTDSTADWGSPRIIAKDGLEGLAGISTYLFSVFQRSATTPATPTGGSYNFTTNTPTAPTGWFDEIPEGSNPLYISTALASTSGPTGIDSTLTWSTSRLLAQDGYTPIKDTDYFDGTSSYLHIKYSDDGATFTGNNGEDVGSWIGTLIDQTEADSLVFSDYTFQLVVGSSPVFERYYTNTAGLASEIGTPSSPGIGISWISISVSASTPATAYWVAERFTLNGVNSSWQIYPVQAKDGGIPFVTFRKVGFNMPVLGSAQWITDAVAAVVSFTGRNYTNQKEFGYGTVVVIEYDDGKLAGIYKRSGSSDVWVTPTAFIDGDLIVDGTIAANHLQANTIDATKLVITGLDAITYSTVGADAAGSASTAQSNAISSASSDATTKANAAQSNAISSSSSDATAKANAAETAANLATAQELAANVYSSGTTTIDGGKITTNTITAGSIVAGTITGWTINGNTIIGGTININSGAFEVNGSGVCWVRDGIFGGTGHFASANGFTALYAQNTSTGISVWGQSTGAANSTNHGVRGQNTVQGTSGLVGPSTAFDFYAETGGGYGPFTGSHDALTALTSLSTNGDIMVDVVSVCRSGLSNTIFEVIPSSTPNQKGAIGVYSGFQGLLANQYEPAAFVVSRDEYGTATLMPEWDAAKSLYNLVKVNALGEGQINIIGEGGDLVAGDLIVTSSTTGKGMKQADDIVRSYTVAKVREAVTFTTPTEERQVACVYLCG